MAREPLALQYDIVATVCLGRICLNDGVRKVEAMTTGLQPPRRTLGKGGAVLDSSHVAERDSK